MPNKPTIRDTDLHIVQQILAQCLPKETQVSIFGSRAKDTAKPWSDLDLAIDAGRPLTAYESLSLADAFEDSDLPYKVDVVDWHRISESFQKRIHAHHIPLKFYVV